MADSKHTITTTAGETLEGWRSHTTDGIQVYTKTRTQARAAKGLTLEALRAGDYGLLETPDLPTLVQGGGTVLPSEHEVLQDDKPIELPIPYTQESAPITPAHVAIIGNPRTGSQVALFQRPAWHGYGNLIPQGLTPAEAFAAGDLDWEVKAVRPTWTHDIYSGESTTCQLVLRLPREGRTDANGRPERIIELAKTGVDWKPIQNREMFEVAQAGAGEGLLLESAGSFRQGRRVFALLKADSFVVGKSDQVQRYLLLAMGHDSELTFRAVPLSIRVACENALRMALKSQKYYSIRRVGDVDARKSEMAKAIAHFKATGTDFEEVANGLQRRVLKEKDIRDFFLKAWQTINGNAKETEGFAARTEEALVAWQTRMEIERLELGMQEPTAWLAMNAVTHWIQHRPAARETKDPTKTLDLRMHDNLMGVNDTLTSKVFESSLALLAK